MVRELLELRAGDDRVHEERAVAARVGIGGIEDHALAAADGDHGIAHFLQRRVLVHEFPELGVADGRTAVRREPKGDAEDDVAVFRPGLEDAVAVREAAVPVGQRDHAAGVALENLDADDGLAHFLPVRADVLDGRGAGGAWDAGQALQARPPVADGESHEVVPILAGGDAHDGAGRLLALHGDAAQRDLHDHAVEALVGDEEVASAGEDEQRLALIGGPGHHLAHLVHGRDAHERLRRPTDADGCQYAERHISLNVQSALHCASSLPDNAAHE